MLPMGDTFLLVYEKHSFQAIIHI